LARKGSRKSERVDEAREAQMIWTFCVAVAVAVAALYRFNRPESPFASDGLAGSSRSVYPLIQPSSSRAPADSSAQAPQEPTPSVARR
jgi:hypothetical protein